MWTVAVSAQFDNGDRVIRTFDGHPDKSPWPYQAGETTFRRRRHRKSGMVTRREREQGLVGLRVRAGRQT